MLIVLYSQQSSFSSNIQEKIMRNRQLFMNACTILMMIVVVLHFSDSYNKTVVTFEFKTLTFVLADSCFESPMLLDCRNADLTLSTHTFIFSSYPPCLSMMLNRYVENLLLYQCFTIN